MQQVKNINTKSLDIVVKGTIQARGSIAKVGSRSYFAGKLDKTLHPILKCYEDVKEYCDKHKRKKVYGVYLRRVLNQIIKVKIGKGVVYYLESKKKAILTRDHNSADEQPLETDVFIPCESEEAALTLEDALHRHFGKVEKVHQSVIGQVKISDTRWLKPGINSEGSEGGTENFTFEDIWDTRIDVFVDAIKFLTKQSQINQQNFTKKARDPQVTGSDLLCEWLLNGGKLEDFYLLMKPRAGKNATMFWGIAKYVEILKQTDPNKTITIDFMSLWPSAFGGALDDLDKMFYVNGVTLKGVNTSDDDWQETYEALLLEPTVDAVFRFASLQSIDLQSAKNYNQDEDREGAEINFVPGKSEYFKSNPGDLCIIDESDHGMRTDRSTDVLTEFGYTKRVWMSGTDLYALKNKIVYKPIQNHFLYDILSEVQDVIAGKHHMPRMKKHSLIADILPGEHIDREMMDQKEITRKLVAMFEVTEKYGTLDAVKNRFIDQDGNILKFKYISEVKRLWNMIYYWADEIDGATDTPSPEHLKHIFSSMPSVKSCMAMYNHIQSGDIECEHEILLANLFGSADRIEQQVNDAMEGKRTIFFTVGKMLRGAKAPWNGVIRLDRYNDYKVGLQLELRGQNTNEDWFHVYDANCFRAESMNFELHKSRSKSFGKKVDSEGKKLHSLIPMTRKGKFREETVTWDNCVTSWQAGRITDSFRRDTLFDQQGLLNAQDLLEGATKTQDNQKGSKDDREGKEGSSKKTPTGPLDPKQIDQLKVLRQQAKTLSTMLPMLLVISNCKYREIDTLISNTSSEDLEDLLKDKCNIKHIDKDFKKKIVKMFDAEEINHQLYITSKKLENGKEIDWTEFNNASNDDVVTTPEEAVTMVNKVSDLKNVKVLVDVSCGTGEIPVQAVINGYKGKIYLFDCSNLNIKITKTRLEKLGFDNIETFKYNSVSVLKTAEEFRETIMNKIEPDLIVGNPPYKGQSQLHQQFFNQAVDLVKPKTGQVIFIQPGTVYFNKKESTDKNSQSMRNNVKEYKTSVQFVSPTVFDNAKPFNDLAITKLTKVKSLDTIESVTYTSGKTYNNVKLENVTKLEMDPNDYEKIVSLYKKFIQSHGNIEDIITTEPDAEKVRIAAIRGNIGQSDWYTFIPNSDDLRLTKGDEGILTYDSVENAEAIIHNLKLTSIRFGLAIYKFSTDLHGGAVRGVPLINFYKKHTDDDVYNMIGITKEQKEKIEEVIPKYYD